MRKACRRIALVTSMMLLATTAALAQAAQPSARNGGALEWISVVLLVGQSQEGPASGDDIPAGVRNALADVREFLPFRSYRLYDAALLRPPGRRGETSNAWLRGSGTQVLEARIVMTGSAAEPPDAQGPFTLQFNLREPVDAQARKSDVDPRDRTLMSTTVRLALGETVVVGTSRLRGDTALIVLLTAVPAKR